MTHLSRRFTGLPDEEVIEGVQHVRIPSRDAPRSFIALKYFDLLYSLRVMEKLPIADILVTNTSWIPTFVRNERFGKLYVHVARSPKGQMRFYRHAARVQTVSHAVGDAIAAEAPSLVGRLRVIPNPVGCGELLKSATPSARRQELLYVGRIHPEKGIHLLLEALLRVPREHLAGWRLVLVGPAAISAGGGGEAYQAELERLARPLNGCVEWVGPIYEPSKLDEYYRRATLFVYPSLAERGETFGLAPLEAMACGCPALVSSLACFSEFIEQDVTGFIFNHRGENPADELAATLRNLMESPHRLMEIGQRAVRKAQEFTVERIASLYLEDFQSLCDPENHQS